MLGSPGPALFPPGIPIFSAKFSNIPGVGYQACFVEAIDPTRASFSIRGEKYGSN